MTEYFIEKKFFSKMVRRGEFLEINFEVLNPGEITIRSEIQPDPYCSREKINTRLDLLNAIDVIPIVTKSGDYERSSFLSYHISTSELASSKQWTARLTNLNEKVENLALEVCYPGEFLIKTLTLPSTLLASIFQSTMGQVKICLTSGEKASYFIFPKSIGLDDDLFTIPDFDYTIDKLWPIPDIHLKENINNIHSCDTRYSFVNTNPQFPNGCLRFTFCFEEHDAEILGTYHCQLHHIQLNVDIDLKMNDHKICYAPDTIQTSFDFEFNIFGLDERIKKHVQPPISNYAQNIREIIEHKIRKIFMNENMHRFITNSLQNYLFPILGNNYKILNFRIDKSELTISYFEI